MTNQNQKKIRLFIVAPARRGSTRLPNKPLLDLNGQPVVAWVAKRAAKLAQRISLEYQDRFASVEAAIATDDSEIADVVAACGVKSIMTDAELPSGTDRIYQSLVRGFGLSTGNSDDLVINIQGDEPFFSECDVLALVRAMVLDRNAGMGTLGFIRSGNAGWCEFIKSQVVKIVLDDDGYASYFSRAMIPWPRAILGAQGSSWSSDLSQLKVPDSFSFIHHIGVYAYRYDVLHRLTQKLRPSATEISEGLEQLRGLAAGTKIKVVMATQEPVGIDTAQDLEHARDYAVRMGAQI